MILIQYKKKEEEGNLYAFLTWGGWDRGSHLPTSCSFSKFSEVFIISALGLRKNNQNKFLRVEQENGGIISLQIDAVLPENTIKNNLSE